MGPAEGPLERPFVGLRPFQTRESLLFFGRQRQVVELLEKLHRTHFVGVIGSSGSGKSSLILAGLIPALQAGFLVGGRDRWIVATATPGDSPWPRFAAELAKALKPLGLEGDADSLRETAESGGVSALVELLEPPLMKADANLLLLVDQFEEIFRRNPETSRPDQYDEDADFVSVLLGLAQQRATPVFVVLTMRSDHLEDCDHFFGLPEALNAGQYLVPRLALDEVRVAIEGPARLFQREVEPRLVDRLLSDLGGHHDQLPVLQHALMRMWEYMLAAGGTTLTLEHYRLAGTLAGALSQDAERALAGMSEADVQACKLVFQALTDTDPAHRKIRRWQSLGELEELTGRDLDDLKRLLERFREDRRSFLRFLGPGGPNNRQTLVDISHEALIRQWERLRLWVQEETRNRDTYVRIRDAARRWEARSGSLILDPELALARRWWDEFRPTPVWARRYGDGFEASRRLLAESERDRDQKLRDERERHDLKIRNAQLRYFLFGAVILALVAGFQWRRAQSESHRAEAESRRAESGEHAAWSLSAIRTDPEKSLLFAIQSVEKAATPTSTDALRRALEGSVVRKLWSVPLRNASGVAFSPDGRRLAAGSFAGADEPGRAGIWDVVTGELLASVCGYDVAALHWTSNGEGLLLGLKDNRVGLWRPPPPGAAGGAVTDLVSGSDLGEMEDLDVSPDGHELALALGSKGLARFDLSLEGDAPSARPKAPLAEAALGHREPVSSLAYSADGRLALGSGGSVIVIRTADGQLVCKTRPLARGEIIRVGFSGSYAAAQVGASGLDNTVRKWPLPVCEHEPTRFVGHRNPVTDFAFTDEGDVLLSVSQDGTFRLWDTGSGDEVFSRRMLRSDAARRNIRYEFSRLAMDRAPVPARGTAGRIRAATVGVEPEADEPDDKSETLTLWDVGPRRKGDALSVITSGPVDDPARVEELLRMGRTLEHEPRILADQVPRCAGP